MASIMRVFPLKEMPLIKIPLYFNTVETTQFSTNSCNVDLFPVPEWRARSFYTNEKKFRSTITIIPESLQIVRVRSRHQENKRRWTDYQEIIGLPSKFPGVTNAERISYTFSSMPLPKLALDLTENQKFLIELKSLYLNAFLNYR